MIPFFVVRQAAETTKYNRELLGKSPRKPFERAEGKTRIKPALRSRAISAHDALELSAFVAYDNQREIKRRLIALILALPIIAFLFWGLMPLFHLLVEISRKVF